MLHATPVDLSTGLARALKIGDRINITLTVRDDDGTLQEITVSAEVRFRSPVVVAWISANVCHINTNAVAIPREIARQFSADLRTVNVSINGAHWFEVPQAFQ